MAWVPGSVMPSPRHRYSYGVGDNRFWVFGGYDNDSPFPEFSSVYSYDPATDSWALEAPLPATTAGHGTVAVIGNLAYVMVTFDSFISYDLTTGAQVTLTPPGSSIDSAYNLIAVGGLVYYKFDSWQNAQVYDPGTDSWSAITPAFPSGNDVVAAATDGTYIYVYRSQFDEDWIRRYDPGTDSWTTLALNVLASNADRPYENAMAYHDGRLYLFGGRTVASTAASQLVLTFDIASTSYVEDAPDLGIARSAAGGGNVNGTLVTATGIGTDSTETLSLLEDPTATLSVSLDVTFDPEAVLSVGLSTVAADSPRDYLIVALNTGYSPDADLRVDLSTHYPDGDATPPPSGYLTAAALSGGVIVGDAPTDALQRASASLSASFGRGKAADLEVAGEVDLTGVSRVKLEQWMVPITGTPLRYVSHFGVLANPDGMRGGYASGAPSSSLRTRDPLSALGDTILPELVPVSSEEEGAPKEGDPLNTSPLLYPLDAELGDYGSAPGSAVCEANKSIKAVRGTALPTRGDIAKQAAAAAGVTLHLLGSVPGAGTEVEAGYRTEGQTAMAVIRDLLLGGGSRYWADVGTLVIDARVIAAGATSNESGFTGLGPIVKLDASYQDQAATDPGPEPILQDYIDEETRGGGGVAPEGDTFETLDDAEYDWWVRSGGGKDYSETYNRLKKVGGSLVEEEQRVRKWVVITEGYEAIRNVTKTLRTHTYHEICPDALVETIEQTVQRKTLDDLQNFSSELSQEPNAEGEPPWRRSTEQILYDAIPTWYTLRRTALTQKWHAEGWLRERSEKTREFHGMVAEPVYNVSGDLSAYNVTLLYRYSARTEIYTPVGDGLWHINTSVFTYQNRPVYEPINPDAVQGDPDYGETELVGVRSDPTTNVYVVVTDQAPPSVSCDAAENECDPKTPTERAQERYDLDHAIWAERQQQGRAKRVWSVQTDRLAFGYKVGDLINGGIVAGVSHSVGGGTGSSAFEIWQYRE